MADPTSQKRASVGSLEDAESPAQQGQLLTIFKKKKVTGGTPGSPDTAKNKSTTPRKVAIDVALSNEKRPLSLNLSAAKSSTDLPELNLSQASPAQHRQRPRPSGADQPPQQATVQYYFLGNPVFQAFDDFELFRHYRELEDQFSSEAGASTPFPFHKTKVDQSNLYEDHEVIDYKYTEELANQLPALKEDPQSVSYDQWVQQMVYLLQLQKQELNSKYNSSGAQTPRSARGMVSAAEIGT